MKKNKSRQVKLVNDETLLVGVDIAKHTHFARFVYPDGSQSKSFSFVNSKSGFNALISKIVGTLDAEKLSKVVLGLESTGHYWKPLAFMGAARESIGMKDGTDAVSYAIRSAVNSKSFIRVSDNQEESSKDLTPFLLLPTMKSQLICHSHFSN